MPSFSHLVNERVTADPRQFLAQGRPASTHNPFSERYAQSVEPIAQPRAQSVQNSVIQPQSQQKQTSSRKPYPERYAKERAETDALKLKVDIIQLSLVMQMLGALGHQDNDKSKWKIPGIGNITVTGQKWWNLEAEVGGHGAVGLVRHAKNIKYPVAVRWLADTFGESIDSDDIKASISSMAVQEKKTFSPPAKYDKNISFVKHYLKFTRKIPEELIDSLIMQGRIYADEDRNCVFASEGIAELRSSFDGQGAVKKLVPGSTRKKGFLVLPDASKNERTLGIVESAIDAMSYRALNPGRAAISSAGANRSFPRAIAEEAIENGFKIAAAFDADAAGDKASQALFNHFYLKLWLKHKAQTELGKEIDEDDVFKLLDSNTVICNLVTKGDEVDDDEAFEIQKPTLPETSPPMETPQQNLLFFNKTTPFDDPENPPVILVTIKKNEFNIPQCSDFQIKVTPKGYDFIITKLGLTRDRPKGEKDWNEILKKTPTHQAVRAIVSAHVSS